MSNYRWLIGSAGLIGALVVLGACDNGNVTDPDDPLPLPVPQITAISTNNAAVGDELRFSGANFISADEGYVEITFRGVYEQETGGTEQVNYTVQGTLDSASGELVVGRFGPYQIPFTRAGNVLGTFNGDIFATNIHDDGRQMRQLVDQNLSTNLTVMPSLVVREVTAHGEGWESSCRNVGTRLINWVPYRVTVEAVGFEAESFNYGVSDGALDGETPSSEPITITHEPEFGPTTVDSIGELEMLRFAEVPFGVPVYRASLAISAEGTDGFTYDQFLMVTVHQPVYVRYHGVQELAEILPPVAVSGCIPGGTQGRDVSYSETTAETRSISESHQLSNNWSNTYTEQHSESYGEGGSEANRIGFASSDQNDWNWNVNGQVMVGGEAGVPLVTKGKVEVRVGGGRDWGGSHTDTQSGEQSWTSTQNFTAATSATESLMESLGETFGETWTVSSSSSESLNFRTFLFPNHFGVFYRQTTRLVRRGEIVAMDLCGNETVVGEIIVNDYTWAPDLAMSTDCPPFPESNFPEPECFVDECEGI